MKVIYLHSTSQMRGGNVKYWRYCNRNNGCKARLHMEVNDVIIARSGVYTYRSNAVGVEVERLKTSMKKRAQDTIKQPSQTVNTLALNVDY